MAPRTDNAHRQCVLSGFAGAAFAVFGLALPFAPDASAQTGVLSPGDGILNQFSGLTTGPTGGPLPDPNGVTVRAIGLGNPGFAADGSVWSNPSLLFSLTAADTGQVFGIAFDDEEPPNAYLAATSAYGLYRDTAGNDWAPGMWGPGGGPGTVWKLEASSNYSPVPFANLTGEDGTENGGVALGGIAFDAWNRQLFVSDLESGLIHRIALDSGETLQTFDHGLDGRSYFLDVPSGQYLVLDVIPDSTETTPRFDDCTDASGAAASFEETPDCWNYADFRRRVWGLGLQRDPVTDTVRLYYAVWGGAALGSDGWETAGDDAETSIWSIRLDGNGGFDLTDVRREFIVPPLIPEEEGAGPSEAPPVTDIAFSSDGAMLLAERGRPAPDFSASPVQLVQPDAARVLLFIRNEEGVWDSEGRYDVGFRERGPDSPPHIRANASGGVSLGNGYTDTGEVDPQAIDSTVWMSGDPLCAPDGPCIDRQTGQPTVVGPIGGFQGTPIANTSDLVPAAAAQPGANTSGPATQPEGPLSSYMIAAGGAGAVGGGMGDIAIFRGEPPSQIVETVEPPEEVAPEVIEEARVPDGNLLPDLAVAKSGLGQCVPGGECIYEVSVTNRGPIDYVGPIMLTDTIGSPGVSLVSASPEPWSCFPADGNVYCQYPTTTLTPGASTAFTIQLRPSPNHSEPRLNNCAAVTWLGLQGRDRIRAVQAALRQSGFDPGSADGIMGPNTSSAIAGAEASFGLPQTGEISPGLIEALFGPGANQDGDASPANDQDCAIVPVDVPLPAGHLVQVSGFHRKFDSINHNPATSAPYDYHNLDLSYFHRTWQSSLHDTVASQPIPIHRSALSQFHLTWGSAFHDGVYTRFVPIHSVGLSGFHGTYQSILHDYRTTALIPSHRYALSSFHRSWTSARHDGIVTRVAPLHWVQLSAFHRKFASGLHDRVVTRLRPIHNLSLSNFHNFNQSSLHDPLTSRVRPIHQLAVSNFHRNTLSALHNPVTSTPRPGHLNNISFFHRTFVSAQHQPLTTRLRPIHALGLSNFHRNNASAIHNGRTSQPLTQHLVGLSTFHRNSASNLHNPATTRAQPIHAPAVSAFHQGGLSRLHNAATSRAAPVHAPAVSTFHRNSQSALHNGRTSQGVSPSHQLGLSNFHRSAASAQHNNRTSQGVSPAHLPAVSSFHRNRGSAQHEARTSGAKSPAHNANLSNAAKKPPGAPVHSPALSRTTQPAHNKNRSDAAAKPGHNQVLSNTTRPPTVPKQPVHTQALSNVTRPPAHSQALSNARQQPVTPKKPVHSNALSNATRQPPKQPVHNQAVSNAARQPVHSQALSNATRQPAHSQALSNAARKPAAPKQPAHSTALSNATRQPQAPKQPAVQQPKKSQGKSDDQGQANKSQSQKQKAKPKHDPRVSQTLQYQQQLQQQQQNQGRKKKN